MSLRIARYGWTPDLDDPRDRLLTIAKPVALPPSCDLRAGMPPVYDQGQLGSCTANAVAAAVDFERGKQGEPFVTPSRLFIYYNERLTDGSVSNDTGAQIRDGIKSVASQGVCPESEWPYDESKFAVKPGASCYSDAVKFEALAYSRVTQDAYYVRHCLAVLGRPVAFGFSVFKDFESDAVARTGIVAMPGADDEPVGGHAVLAAGYDDASQSFLVRNSWGADWGQAGYFRLPYAYLLDADLASDFWVITRES